MLTGVVVCVDYADFLAAGLQRWRAGLDRLLVITATKDLGTQRLCQDLKIETHVTDIFYANGAAFNKGAALAEAFGIRQLRQPPAEWLLTFDADIVPPPDWRRRLDRINLQPGTLYGSWRYQADAALRPGRRMAQSWVIGFFCLFHALDPCLPSGPIFDACWPHAGNYDTMFCRRWPKERQMILDLPLVHLGDDRRNWAGRYKPEVLQQFLRARRAKNGWQHERMDNPPTVGQNE